MPVEHGRYHSVVDDLDKCISQGFYSCTNIMTEKQVGEERVYLAYTFMCCLSPKKVRTETQAGQEVGADAEAMEGCYWLASPGLLSLLSYRTQVYQPRNGSTHNGLGQGWLHPQWAGSRMAPPTMGWALPP